MSKGDTYSSSEVIHGFSNPDVVLDKPSIRYLFCLELICSELNLE